jgi:hypothetical protein
MKHLNVLLGHLVGICATSLALTSPATAFDATSRIEQSISLNSQCGLTAFVQNLNGGLASVRVRGLGVAPPTRTQAAGGTSYFNGGLSTTFSAITVGNLEANCSLADVANLVQQGAAGTYAADASIGVSFEATRTSDGDRYAYLAEISGATATTVAVRQTLVNAAPTVTLGSLSGPNGSGDYTVIATLSESSSDFTSASMALSNATATVSGSGSNYTIVLSPIADGAVSASVPKGAFTDSAGLGNWIASDDVVFSVDTTAPTVSIAAFTGVTNGNQTALITLSEASTDFGVGDLSLTNATATLTGAGTSYSAILTPVADGQIALSVAANTFTDAAGNGNTASNDVTTIFDGTRPTVSISNAPSTVNAMSSFSVSLTFSESVTGFDATDITASHATVTNLTGSGAVYQAQLTATGGGGVSLMVPENAVFDASSNGNIASDALNIADITVEKTQELIASFTQTRANQLLRSQPDLMGFLSGQEMGAASAQVLRGQGQFNYVSPAHQSVWARAQGAWISNTDSESLYMFGALGSHVTIDENLLIGGMVQFDHLKEDSGAASVSGTGWMVGPYFVAKNAEQPLYFEGRLLYGETNNSISPFGTYKDDFATTRMLAQVRVTGEYAYGSNTTLYPFFDASYTTDDQHSFVDSLGNTIPDQGIRLGQTEFGLDFKQAIPLKSGTFELLGGVSGIWSNTSGSGFASTISPDYEGGRMRVDLGMNRELSASQRFYAATYYDGIGATGFESYGVSLGYETHF